VRAIAALCLVAVVVSLLLVGRGDDDDGASRADDAGTAGRTLSNYRIVYRVEDLAGAEKIVSTRELAVRRPFDSALEQRGGPPPGGQVQSRVVTTFGLYSSTSAAAATLVVGTRPGPPVGDLRLDVMLPDLVADGRLVRAGNDRVVGRDCRVFRTREPLADNSPPPPTPDDHTDLCIDAHGLVLREEWVLGGRLTRRTTAVAVEERPLLRASLFETTADPIPVERGGIELVEANDTPATWTISAPADYRRRGSYMLLSALPPVEGIARPPQATRVDVYVSGPRLLVVEQGQLQGAAEAPEASRRIDVPGVGRGYLVSSARSTVITVYPDAVTFVRLSGTMPAAALERLAGQLQRRK
jgi:hypothetical protein